MRPGMNPMQQPYAVPGQLTQMPVVGQAPFHVQQQRRSLLLQVRLDK